MLKLRKANRLGTRLRVGFSGPSGSGKTMSALRVGYGLVGDWSKIALIDTENGSGELYADRTYKDAVGEEFTIGAFQYIGLSAFHPEQYVEAIRACELEGIELIIIDSISHEWEAVLAIHGAMPGNSFQNWAAVTPRHELFKQKILQSPAHIFTTVRRKQDYEITKEPDQNGNLKTKVNKLGLKEETRSGWDYELTVNLEIETTHLAKAGKDRTGLFVHADPFVLTEIHGQQLKAWAESGVSDLDEVRQVVLIDIENAQTRSRLNTIYIQHPTLHADAVFLDTIKKKKLQLSV